MRSTILCEWKTASARLLCVAVLLLLAGCGEPAVDPRAAANPSPPTGGLNTPFIVPGIRQPAMHLAADVDLPDETQVIGISSAGASRAYTVHALSSMSTHVINDLLEGVPVSVTYCDQTRCARVLSTERGDEPIDLWTGGFANGQLTVMFESRMYLQTSQELPFHDHPFTLTTWKEWRESHPETLVYTGGGQPHLPEPADDRETRLEPPATTSPPPPLAPPGS